MLRLSLHFLAISFISALQLYNIQRPLVFDTNLFAGTIGGGIFRTTKNGTSWTAANSGLSNKYVLTLFKYGDTLFACTEAGAYRSTHNGSSWPRTLPGLQSNIVYHSLALILILLPPLKTAVSSAPLITAKTGHRLIPV